MTDYIIENENLLVAINSRQEELTKLSNYLEELESQLSLIFAMSPDLILLIDKDGIILRASEIIKFLLGYEKFEVVGKSLWSFIYSEDIESVKNCLELLKTKKVLYPTLENGLVSRWITKKQELLELVWRFAICNNKEEQIVGIASNIAAYTTKHN